MLTRKIPSSGEELPVVGLGTWPSFDVGAEERARAPLREVLSALFAGGGRLVDTSPMYGSAEGVLGDLVGELEAREKAFLATKVWTSGRERGEEEMRRSAERLKTGIIDLIQIHNLVDWRTHLRTLRAMKEKGVVRYLGITHYTRSSLPELAQILRGEAGIDFVQCGYSLAMREAEEELLPVAADKGVAVIVNQPFLQGTLPGRMRGRELPGWAADCGCASWAELCLKYVLAEGAVTCVIPATRNPLHLRENLAAGSGALPDARQRAEMRAFWDAL
jgi:aryl-alcohol dehydrogenase-like predicted oxidoreductase